ncbi:glycoside hydrolase family 28 protein [Pontiella desulfatans]|nr:glycoside hydrolase family 28 protein [Pontiella desulfatans]
MLTVMFGVGLGSCQAATLFNVRTYGAIGDGVAMDTKAMQAAIDACHASEGGVVYVPAGSYHIGTIKLKSNVELRLDEGAELLGSLSINDYARDIQGAIEGPAFDECLVYAENSKNIRITGGGIINGRGHTENFPIGPREAYHDRPMLIRFVDCVGVVFENVTFKDAASWCTHLVNCDEVVARKVTIDSHVNRNNDGFDLDGCKNVLLEECTIRTGDDAICPKSTTTRLCENIVVKNCRAESNTSAFKCGTSSRGGFKNITVSNCDFSGTRMGAIKLLSVDGGILEDITIDNIVMNDVEGPIFIRLANRGRKYDKPTEQIQKQDVEPEGVPVGNCKNIRISNIKATVTSDIQKRCGIMISGIPGHCIENVMLENIEISYPGGGTAEDAEREIAEDIARYPEQFFFGVLPSWGAYVRHAKNVEFRNLNMGTRAPDAREMIVADDVEGFVVK